MHFGITDNWIQVQVHTAALTSSVTLEKVPDAPDPVSSSVIWDSGPLP